MARQVGGRQGLPALFSMTACSYCIGYISADASSGLTWKLSTLIAFYQVVKIFCIALLCSSLLCQTRICRHGRHFILKPENQSKAPEVHQTLRNGLDWKWQKKTLCTSKTYKATKLIFFNIRFFQKIFR